MHRRRRRPSSSRGCADVAPAPGRRCRRCRRCVGGPVGLPVFRWPPRSTPAEGGGAARAGGGGGGGQLLVGPGKGWGRGCRAEGLADRPERRPGKGSAVI